jgi:hypothetical protein
MEERDGMAVIRKEKMPMEKVDTRIIESVPLPVFGSNPDYIEADSTTSCGSTIKPFLRIAEPSH